MIDMIRKGMEEMKITLFGKKYNVTQYDLTEIYRGIGIHNAEFIAEYKFEKFREEKRLEKLKKEPEKLLAHIKSEMQAAISLDYLTTGGYSEEANSLIKFLPEGQLKELEKYVSGSYKETIDKVRKERAQEQKSKNTVEKNKKANKRSKKRKSPYDGQKITVKLFNKDYALTHEQLIELYEGLDIDDAEIEADFRFEEEEEKEYQKELEKNPEKMLNEILNLVEASELLDFGMTNYEAINLIEKLPEEQLKQLEAKVDGEYKEKIDEVRRTRKANEEKLKKKASHEEIEFE